MAQGSHKTYAGWEKRTCDRCGGKLTQEGPSCLWGQRLEAGRWIAFSYHVGKCPEKPCAPEEEALR